MPTTTETRQLVAQLYADFSRLYDRDVEEEISERAMPVIDAVLSEVKRHLAADDPILATIHDLVSAETISTGDPIRVADLLPVVGILKARLGPEPAPVPIPVEVAKPWGTDWRTEPF